MAQTVGFSRALKMPHRGIFARRDAKRRARAVRIPPCNPCIVRRKNKIQHPAGCCLWRRRWDSNPRDIAVKLISSVVGYSVFGLFFRNLPESAGKQFLCTSQKIFSKSVQINAVTCGFEPNLALLQAVKKVENFGSFGPVLAHFEDVGENFGENEKGRFSA